MWLWFVIGFLSGGLTCVTSYIMVIRLLTKKMMKQVLTTMASAEEGMNEAERIFKQLLGER